MQGKEGESSSACFQALTSPEPKEQVAISVHLLDLDHEPEIEKQEKLELQVVQLL